jgi:hypothetical protein
MLVAPPTLNGMTCPGLELPLDPVCPGAMPPACATICTACSACVTPAEARTPGEGLLACEAQAAMKNCSSCEETGNVMACSACRDAIRCELDNPGSSECDAFHAVCDGQGNDGCYSTPIARPRSQLTESEQSMMSPAVSLQGAGDVVLTFDYVPFDIREVYRRVIQGQTSTSWPVEDQEVVVELCAGDCLNEANWMEVASYPKSIERRNGVRIGAQSLIDWRNSRAEIPIPANMLTADFHFRFVPKLADGVRFGIDNIQIRRPTR